MPDLTALIRLRSNTLQKELVVGTTFFEPIWFSIEEYNEKTVTFRIAESHRFLLCRAVVVHCTD